MKQKRVVVVCIVLVFSIMYLSGEQVPYSGYRQVKTDRFTFIYEPEDASAVQSIAQIADWAYEELAILLDHRPSRPIPVVITSRPAQANGFFSPMPPKITLYVTSPADRFIGSRTENWLHTLFLHELVHYFHLTSRVGPAKFLTPLFGPDVPAMNALLMPGWWVEGITTYLESHLVPGGRGDSPSFAFTYEAPLLEDTMWSLSRGAYRSLNPPSSRIYTTGLLMVEHLMEHYDTTAFAEINRRFATWPFFGMGGPFTRVIGRSPADIYAEALEGKRTALPSSYAVRQRISPQVKGHFYLPFATEQGLIGQASTLKSGGHFFRYDEESGLIARAAIQGSDAIAVTGDGSAIYFIFGWSDPHVPGNIPLAPASHGDLYRFNTDSNAFTPITHKARLAHPAVSPDGATLVATEMFEGRWRLVTVSEETGELSTLYDHPEGQVYQPAFSEDGKLLVLVEIVRGGSALVLINLETREAQYLMEHNPAELHKPRFITRDVIWFASDRDGRLALYEFDRELGVSHRILTDAVGITGGMVYDEAVVYETYTADGYALRTVSPEQLDRFSVPFTTIESQPAWEEVRLPESQIYRDHLRFNLWLPFAMNIPEFTAGATVLSRSVLGRHLLQASAGYAFDTQLPMANIVYQYTPGPYRFTAEASVNEIVYVEIPYQRHRFTSSVTIPLWYRPRPVGSTSVQLSISPSLSLGAGTDVSLLTYISWATGRYERPKDFFGNLSTSGYGGIHLLHSLDEKVTTPIALGMISAQTPIGTSHQVIRISAESRVSLSGHLIDGLSPTIPNKIQYTTIQGGASSLFTGQYRIPFGVIDIPIPHGGITGMGLTLQAQKLAHVIDGQVSWEDTWFLGALLDTHISLGASLSMRMQAGMILDTEAMSPAFVFSLTFDDLFRTYQDAPTF